MQKHNIVDESMIEGLESSSDENTGLDIKRLIAKLLTLWPWLILCGIVGVVLAFVYLKFTRPAYKIKASILVQDDKKGATLGEAGVLEDLGLMLGKSNVDNEVEIFKSRTLMEQVVKDLQLNVQYFVTGKVRKIEVFQSRPVNLRFVRWNIIKADEDPILYAVKINKQKNEFQLEFNDKVIKGALGDSIELREGRAIVEPSGGFMKWDTEETLHISVTSQRNQLRKYMEVLDVEVPNKLVSIINLSLDEALPDKGEIILNTLISEYLQANVADKGRVADSTVRFIDERLGLVFSELSGIEKDIEKYKVENNLTDLSEQAKILLANTSEYAKELTTQEVQLSVVVSLEDFLKNNINSSRIVPASLVVQEPNLIALVQRYNELQLQRDKLLMSVTANHPSIATIDTQLDNIRQDLLSGIRSVRQGLQVGISELKKRTGVFEQQISKVPRTERIFLDYSRQQAIKQELYLFLLKKREETAISKSSTLADARIIDTAKSDALPFKPQRQFILALGLIAGLAIPIGISLLKDFLNTKVASIEDIASITATPVLAEIGHNPSENVVVVTLDARSIIAEQFRSLRTNIGFLLAGVNDKVLLITSNMSGEGKSFLSVNMAASLALAGKKVILLELDLRRPKISETLKLQKQGFTNYIISGNDDWKKWLQRPSMVQPQHSFDVFSSGPIPPNPAELLMLPKTASFFEELKAAYDYVIIDSAPVGLVTDAQILATYADVTLFMVRHLMTHKEQIKLIDRLYRKKILPNMNIVVNDVQLKKGGGYGYYQYYGYGYGYGYGYVYGDDEPKRK